MRTKRFRSQTPTCRSKVKRASVKRFAPPSEESEQITVVDFCRVSGIPVVHIPNEGKRTPWQGAKEVKMGLAKGFPDLFIPVPLGQYHGLMIEMKAENGRLSKEQREWLTYLRDHLYATAVCYSEDEAIAVIKKYKSLEKEQ